MITWKLEAYLNGSWFDLTDYTYTGSITANWGIPGNTYFDRMARTGKMNFILRNLSGEFSPGHASCTAGWSKNVTVLLTLTDSGLDYKYRYYVTDITPSFGIYKERIARVSCSDWMNYAAELPLKLQALQTNKTADEGIDTILAAIPISPQATDIETGQTTFPTVFDTASKLTRAYGEINKLVASELGYCYLKRDKTNGETFVFENAVHRNGLNTLTDFWIPDSDGFALLAEDGTYLLAEDGTKLLIDSGTTSNFTADNNMIAADIEYGNNVINFVEVNAYPKKVDTSLITVYSLPQPQAIGSGQTITVTGSYRDPVGGNAINGYAFATPATASGDYAAWTASAGTGTNISGSISIVPTWGAAGFSYAITNNHANSGYLTALNVRGKGIYLYDPIAYVEEDTTSQNTYGYLPEKLDMLYQQTIGIGTQATKTIVELDKDPEARLKKVSFTNSTDELTSAFLNLDVGSVVRITEDQSGIDSYCYIQSVEFRLGANGMITWTWLVRTFLCVCLGLSPIKVEFDGGNYTDINFGVVDSLLNQTQFTWSAWVDPDTILAGTASDIISLTDLNVAGRYLMIYENAGGSANDYYVRYWQFMDGYRIDTWANFGTPLVLGSPHHIVVTRDSSVDSAAAPLMYIDGVQATAVQSGSAISGTARPEIGAQLVIGNGLRNDPLGPYYYPFDGKIEDVRIYNRVLSSTEVTELYNSGTPYYYGLLDGLIFNPLYVKTANYSQYIDTVLTVGMNVLDAVKYTVGKPSGTPTGRTP